MKNNVCKNRGFTLLEILAALAILTILVTALGFALFGGTDKAQLESCNTTLKKLEVARQEYDQLKAEGDTHNAPKACTKLNGLIDKYNRDNCAELTGITANKEICK